MDRLCGALSLCQKSSSNDKESEKKEEIAISKKMEKSLEDWKLPPCSASDVIKRSCIFKFSCDPRVKTVEKEIPLSEGYASFPLFTDNLRRIYNGEALDLYIGIVEVGLKPIKLGSNAYAIICLRDKRRLTFHDSLFGMVESSLSDGPIYFSYVPSHRLDLSDPCLSTCFTLDVKIQGSSTMPGAGAGDGNIILLMYRFHYKLMTRYSEEDQKKLYRSPVDVKGETTLFVTNVGRNNRVVSRKMYWDQLSVPEPWMYANNSSYSSSSSASAAAAEHPINWIEAAEAEAYALQMDITGFEKGEVEVKVQADRNIVISGVRSNMKKKKDKWQSVVRSSGKFLRRFEVPDDANLGEAKAAVENEVLTITLPKGSETSSWVTIRYFETQATSSVQVSTKLPISVYVRW